MSLHVTFPKPLPGEYRLEQKRIARERKATEDRIMAEAKRRDHNKCRFPDCEFKDLRVECAHLEHRGMGGNPALDRTERHKLIALCLRHHAMFDRKTNIDIDIQPLTNFGTDGPCSYHQTNPETGQMEHVFSEPVNFLAALEPTEQDSKAHTSIAPTEGCPQ